MHLACLSLMQDGGNHPLHLHGHWFWVMYRSPENAGDFDGNTSVFVPTPTLRDTEDVRASGHMVIRFVADNPGMDCSLA